MKKVLCVCFGNTCRSPMMVVMLRQALLETEVADDTFEIASAGVNQSLAGQTPPDDAVNEMHTRGFDITRHRSTYIGDVPGINDFDLVLCVDDIIATKVVEMFPLLKSKVHIFNEDEGGISNPWKEGAEAYRQCANTIDSAAQILAAELYWSWR